MPKSRRTVKSQCPQGWNAGDSELPRLQEGAQVSESGKQAGFSIPPPAMCMPPEHALCPSPRQNHRTTVTVLPTSGSDTVETNKRIETGSCSTENPLEAERHKSSRAQRAQAEVEERDGKGKGVFSHLCASSLMPNYSARSLRPQLPTPPPQPNPSAWTPLAPHHAPSSAAPRSEPPDLSVSLSPAMVSL